ncbi:MAG: hypothetical protein RIR25_658, partial [Verrucomicrobiota bacterium]
NVPEMLTKWLLGHQGPSAVTKVLVLTQDHSLWVERTIAPRLKQIYARAVGNVAWAPDVLARDRDVLRLCLIFGFALVGAGFEAKRGMQKESVKTLVPFFDALWEDTTPANIFHPFRPAFVAQSCSRLSPVEPLVGGGPNDTPVASEGETDGDTDSDTSAGSSEDDMGNAAAPDAAPAGVADAAPGVGVGVAAPAGAWPVPPPNLQWAALPPKVLGKAQKDALDQAVHFKLAAKITAGSRTGHLWPGCGFRLRFIDTDGATKCWYGWVKKVKNGGSVEVKYHNGDGERERLLWSVNERTNRQTYHYKYPFPPLPSVGVKVLEWDLLTHPTFPVVPQRRGNAPIPAVPQRQGNDRAHRRADDSLEATGRAAPAPPQPEPSRPRGLWHKKLTRTEADRVLKDGRNGRATEHFIDVYMDLIARRHEGASPVKARLFPGLAAGGMSPRQIHACARGVDIFQYNILLVPVHHGPRDNGHWALALVYPKEGAFTYYDSVPGDRDVRREQVKGGLVGALRSISTLLRPNERVEWDMRLPEFQVSQTNNDDCGYHACMAARAIVEGSDDYATGVPRHGVRASAHARRADRRRSEHVGLAARRAAR